MLPYTKKLILLVAERRCSYVNFKRFYKSNIVVDQRHEFGYTYNSYYMNELYLEFVLMLLNDPPDENDILLRVEWVHEDGSLYHYERMCNNVDRI